MANRVVMPKLTDTMEEGVVLKWMKHEGEPVNAGDVLAEIETDKAVMDLEAFGSGTLRKILIDEGQTVPSGALIAVIAEPDEDITGAMTDTITADSSAQSTPSPATPAGKRPTAPPVPTQARETAPKEPRKVKASPRAKAVAREQGVNLELIKGSGPDGRITERDVLHAAGPARAKVPAGGERPLSQMRKAIARTTTQSKAPVPHFYVTSEIGMDEAERLRAQYNQVRSKHLSVNDLIVKAAALALTKYPEINVSYAGDSIRQHTTIDIGIAVGLDEGLIAPVVRDCGAKSLQEISEAARDLAERARNRALRPEEYTGATFTVSNLGMYDVESFIAVLMPPEAAALAIGSIRDVSVVQGSRIRAARRVKVTMSCDHRALDGVQAAEFLKELKRCLEHPIELFLSEE